MATKTTNFLNQEKKNVKKLKQQPKKKVIVMVPTINLILVMYNRSVKREKSLADTVFRNFKLN